MADTPANTADGLVVVVDSDGALRVPAAELARHGVRPGARLRLVPIKQPPGERSRMDGGD